MGYGTDFGKMKENVALYMKALVSHPEDLKLLIAAAARKTKTRSKKKR